MRILGCVDGDGWGGHGKRVSGKGFKRTDVGRAQPTGGSRIFIIGGRTFNLGCAPPPKTDHPPAAAQSGSALAKKTSGGGG